MATAQFKALTNKGNREVGTYNSIKMETIAGGAIVEGADIDNYTLVELGFNAEGERICKQLSDVTKEAYLIAAPERRYLGEQMVDFYNAVGERARIIVMKPKYSRFETSAYSLNTGVTEIKKGLVAHFEPTTKKYILSNASAPHADYANAYAKFLVVNSEDDLSYTLGKPCVRLEVQKA